MFFKFYFISIFFVFGFHLMRIFLPNWNFHLKKKYTPRSKLKKKILVFCFSWWSYQTTLEMSKDSSRIVFIIFWCFVHTTETIKIWTSKILNFFWPTTEIWETPCACWVHILSKFLPAELDQIHRYYHTQSHQDRSKRQKLISFTRFCPKTAIT